MVEVFKTNVQDRSVANILLNELHRTFATYKASFDLGDCDKILRVECRLGEVNANEVIDLLGDFGFQAAVLPDEPPAKSKQMMLAYPFAGN